MFDKQTKEEAKSALLEEVRQLGVAKIEDLINRFESSFVRDGLDRVPVLMTELVADRLVIELLYRNPPNYLLRSLYFPEGAQTHNVRVLPLEMAKRARLRPSNFFEMSNDQQWAIDKALGILDWDGT